MKTNKRTIRMYGGTDKLFLTACELANKAATHRQFTKWNQGRGAAHQMKGEASRKNGGTE